MQAEASYREMLRLAEVAENRKAQAIALQRLGILYYDRNKQSAEQFYEQSLTLKNELNDLTGQAQLYNNLGLLYEHWGDHERAQMMLEKGVEIHKQCLSSEWEFLSLYSNLGILAARQKQWEQAYHYSELALRIAEESGAPYEIARATFNLGKHDFDRGETEAAREKFQQALTTAEHYNLKDLVELACCALGRLWLDLGQLAQGIEYLQRVVEIQESFQAKRKLSGTYCDLGTAYLRNGDFEQCLHFYNLGASLFEYLTDHDGIDIWLENINSLFQDRGEEKTTRKLIATLKTQRRLLLKKGASYSLARICGALGRIRLQDGLNDKVAIAYFLREIELLSELNRRQEQVAALMNLGQSYQERGVLSKAIAINQQALEIIKTHEVENSFAGLLYNLANCYLQAEDYETATDHYQQALLIAVENKDIQLQQSIEHNLGEAFRRAGKFIEAIEKLRCSLQMANNLNDVQGQVLTLNSLGLAYKELNQFDEAKNSLTQALAICRQHLLLSEESNVLISFGNFYYQDDPVLAREYYEQSFKVAIRAEDFEMEEKAMLSLIFVCRKLGAVEEIQEDFKRVAERSQRLGHYEIFIEFLTIIGEINLSEKEVATAAEMFESAISFSLLQLVRRGEGENDTATELLQIMSRICYSLVELAKNKEMDTIHLFQQELLNRFIHSPHLRDFSYVIEDIISQILAQ